jgi:hypothetical protein
MSRPISIAMLHFAHETVVSWKNDTTLDDCIYTGSPVKGEAVISYDPKYVVGGLVKMARASEGVELAAGTTLVTNPAGVIEVAPAEAHLVGRQQQRQGLRKSCMMLPARRVNPRFTMSGGVKAKEEPGQCSARTNSNATPATLCCAKSAARARPR